MDPSIRSADQPPDLTDHITRTSDYYTAGGGFGDVWQCLLYTGANQVMVAIKVIRPQGDAVDEKALRRELGMWKRLHHANILPLLGTARNFGPCISMVSPWLEKGTLTMYLRTHKDLSLSDRRRLLGDIISGLHYLHSVPVVHGDLTPNNVLLNNERRAVLTDFGLSSMLLGQGYTYLQHSHAQPGAIRYTAPELLDPDAFVPPDTRSDVYSFGCLALHVLSGQEPWADVKNQRSIILRVFAGGTPQRPANSPISDAQWHLIRQCLSPLDTSPPRPTTDEILTFLNKLQFKAVLETQFSGRSNSPAPSSDKKGKKRAIAESDVTSARLRKRPRTLPIQQSMYSTLTKGLDVENMWKRPHPWPICKSLYSTRIKSDGDAGVKEIVFSADGERMAVVCHDRTIRIWSVLNRVETACLKQNSAISSVAWRVDGNAVITLGQDGVVSKWTQNKQNDWHWVKLLRTGKKEPACFASKRDCLAVAFPQFGVKVWLWMKGSWQPQRSILQQNVTCIKFVEDGNALLGGTSDGIFWYCQVPNGTLRSCANLKAKIQSPIDVRGSEIFLFPAENYERLGRFLEMGSKGKIGVVRAPNDERQTSPALVITRDFCVVFHSVESDCLVWDNTTSSVVHCLDHGENEKPQVVAGFDHSCIVTGTAQGLLSWWSDLAAPRSRSTQEPLCTGVACGEP